MTPIIARTAAPVGLCFPKKSLIKSSRGFEPFAAVNHNNEWLEGGLWGHRRGRDRVNGCGASSGDARGIYVWCGGPDRLALLFQKIENPL
jgi:hypothetical protein